MLRHDGRYYGTFCKQQPRKRPLGSFLVYLHGSDFAENGKLAHCLGTEETKYKIRHYSNSPHDSSRPSATSDEAGD